MSQKVRKIDLLDLAKEAVSWPDDGTLVRRQCQLLAAHVLASAELTDIDSGSAEAEARDRIAERGFAQYEREFAGKEALLRMQADDRKRVDERAARNHDAARGFQDRALRAEAKRDEAIEQLQSAQLQTTQFLLAAQVSEQLADERGREVERLMEALVNGDHPEYCKSHQDSCVDCGWEFDDHPVALESRKCAEFVDHLCDCWIKSALATPAAAPPAQPKEPEISTDYNFGDENPTDKESLTVTPPPQEHPDTARGFELWFSREEWGVAIDALIEHRRSSEERKSVNSESTSDERSKMCSALIIKINDFAARTAPEAPASHASQDSAK